MNFSKRINISARSLRFCAAKILIMHTATRGERALASRRQQVVAHAVVRNRNYSYKRCGIVLLSARAVWVATLVAGLVTATCDKDLPV